jgi:hypothetical protein
MIETSASVLEIVCTVLAGISAIFFICGVAGYSVSENDLRTVPWFYSTDFGAFNFGLKAFSINNQGPPQVIAYGDDDECNVDFCDQCRDDGKVAAALTILALFCAVAVTALSAISIAYFSKSMLLTNTLIAALAVILAVVALGIMMGRCFEKVHRFDNIQGLDFFWGPGAILTLVGAILMAVTAVMSAIARALGDQVFLRARREDVSTSTNGGAPPLTRPLSYKIQTQSPIGTPVPPIELEPMDVMSDQGGSNRTNGAFRACSTTVEKP